MQLTMSRLALSLLVAGAGGLLASSARAQAQPRFGVVGLAAGQVARLNVVNVADPILKSFCEVRLSLVDGSGVGYHDPDQKVMFPGQSAFIEVTYAQALLRARPRLPALLTPRLPVRGVVEGIEDPNQVPPECVATLEIYDALSGVTRVIGNPEVRPSPRARDSFGILALARGQVARLNLVNTLDPAGVSDPDEAPVCRAALSFVDGSGVGFEDPDEKILLPGQSGFIELIYAQALGGSEDPDLRLARLAPRLPIRGIVGYSDPDEVPPECVATLEVYDALSGKTWVLSHDPNQ